MMNQCGSASMPKGSSESSTMEKPANAGVVTDDVFNSYLSDLSNLESDGSDGVNEPNSDPTKHDSTDNLSMPSAQDRQPVPVQYYAPPLKCR